MLMSLTIAFRSRRPEASRSATSVVAIPVLPFGANGHVAHPGAATSVGKTLYYTVTVAGRTAEEARSAPGVPDWETRLRCGKTEPCCGTCYIAMRAIPEPAFS